MTLVHTLGDTGPWWNQTALFWHRICCNGWRFIRRQKALKGLLESKKWKARGKDDDFIVNKVVLIIHRGGLWQCVIHFLLMPASLGISCPLVHYCPLEDSPASPLLSLGTNELSRALLTSKECTNTPREDPSQKPRSSYPLLIPNFSCPFCSSETLVYLLKLSFTKPKINPNPWGENILRRCLFSFHIAVITYLRNIVNLLSFAQCQ